MYSSSKFQAKSRLRIALDKIPALKPERRRTASPQFEKWWRNTEIAIVGTFGDKGRHIKDFREPRYPMRIYTRLSSEQELQDIYLEMLNSLASVLESMIEEIEEYWPDESYSQVSEKTPKGTRQMSDKVFIVHGKDTGTKDTVARFLQGLNLNPVVLQELPSKGRTIIEKFEDHAQIGFAVILFTPDDFGGHESEIGDPKPRARQNVIFELGFFIGKLGRSNTCVLFKDDVEIPSDYTGVEYIPLDDANGWKLKLITELQSAGFDVDANQATLR